MVSPKRRCGRSSGTGRRLGQDARDGGGTGLIWIQNPLERKQQWATQAPETGENVAASIIYQSSFGYEVAMLALYRKNYGARYQAIADLIPPGASVLELCCGPGVLYRRYLCQKGIQYKGLDINPKFIRYLTKRGVAAELWDLRSDRALPRAEYVVMQASLYHFLPRASAI